MRKTVDIEKLRDMANAQLAEPASTPDGRETMCAFIETILMDAGQYNGFRYIPTDEVLGAGTRREYY